MRTVELLHHIDRELFQLHFLSLSGKPGGLDGEIRQMGSQVHLCKLGRGFSRRFTTILKNESIDVVHSHVHFSSGYLLRIAEKAGVCGRIAHFRSTHDGRAPTPRRIIQRIISRRLVDRHSTNILSCGRGAMETLFGKNWSDDPRRRILSDSIDESRFAGPPDRAAVCREFGMADDCPLVVHVGNFTTAKNHPFLIAIFAEVKKQLPSARLLLVGSGENKIETRSRTQVEKLNLGDSVIFTGVREDVPRLLLAADLVVFPSKWEGLPGAVLEAAAAGTPVIGSDLPGIRELQPYLSQVQILGLDNSVEEWARAACERIAMQVDSSNRKTTQEQFAASPFSIRKCVSSMCSVWRQHAEETRASD